MPAAAEFSAAVAFMPCCSFSRRENARRSFAPRSCGTIAYSLIFAPRRRLPPLFIFRKAIFAQNPRLLPWVSCSYACACFSRRENARRSFSPRSCGTIAHSLIFAPRRRLPPPFISRKALFAQNPRLLPWVSCSYACACFSRRENARRSKTFIRSLRKV